MATKEKDEQAPPQEEEAPAEEEAAPEEESAPPIPPGDDSGDGSGDDSSGDSKEDSEESSGEEGSEEDPGEEDSEGDSEEESEDSEGDEEGEVPEELAGAEEEGAPEEVPEGPPGAAAPELPENPMQVPSSEQLAQQGMQRAADMANDPAPEISTEEAIVTLVRSIGAEEAVAMIQHFAQPGSFDEKTASLSKVAFTPMTSTEQMYRRLEGGREDEANIADREDMMEFQSQNARLRRFSDAMQSGDPSRIIDTKRAIAMDDARSQQLQDTGVAGGLGAGAGLLASALSGGRISPVKGGLGGALLGAGAGYGVGSTYGGKVDAKYDDIQKQVADMHQGGRREPQGEERMSAQRQQQLMQQRRLQQARLREMAQRQQQGGEKTASVPVTDEEIEKALGAGSYVRSAANAAPFSTLGLGYRAIKNNEMSNRLSTARAAGNEEAELDAKEQIAMDRAKRHRNTKQQGGALAGLLGGGAAGAGIGTLLSKGKISPRRIAGSGAVGGLVGALGGGAMGRESGNEDIEDVEETYSSLRKESAYGSYYVVSRLEGAEEHIDKIAEDGAITGEEADYLKSLAAQAKTACDHFDEGGDLDKAASIGGAVVDGLEGAGRFLNDNSGAIAAAGILGGIGVPMAAQFGDKVVDPIRERLRYRKMQNLPGKPIDVPPTAADSFFIDEEMPQEERDQRAIRKAFHILHKNSPDATATPEIAKQMLSYQMHSDPETVADKAMNFGERALKNKSRRNQMRKDTVDMMSPDIGDLQRLREMSETNDDIQARAKAKAMGQAEVDGE